MSNKTINQQIKTRFAPSPTGFLHVGNLRTALINYLYAKSKGGVFVLRIDDTDLQRGNDIYEKAIINDLKWLGINWDYSFNQSSRLDRYEEVKQKLIEIGRLYPCYETKEELEVKRKLQLSRGLPPIYDRAALKLTEEQKKSYEDSGRRPHYRFLIQDEDIVWQDMVKGEIRYKAENLSDPIVIRADSTMTYMLCSTVDDIEHGITDVIRGEDHVSNTAIQIQMFKALKGLIEQENQSDSYSPRFGHLSLVKAKDDKISKREGGFEIYNLRDKDQIEPMAINSFFALIGSSEQVRPLKSLDELSAIFDISTYSKSPTTFVPEDLNLLNHKLLINLEYDEVKLLFSQMAISEISEEDRVVYDSINEPFWYAVRPNLQKLTDVKLWWNICHNLKLSIPIDSFFENNEELKNFFDVALSSLPESLDENTLSKWTKSISVSTARKGKGLFMPLRLALTGLDSGPELKDLLSILSRQEIESRLERFSNTTSHS